uniref:F-box family-2 n=1 Tax=Oryza coarctata TaxID=77588 RepID=E0CWA2_ORYCO|nr:F-box family-2 [Oryza coarctata]
MPPQASEECGIDDLPDELLEHILSSLPADEAVKTCVLSRRWRHLWKSTAVLRFADTERWKSCEEFKRFVTHLVLFRDSPPLREFDLKFNPCRDEDEDCFLDFSSCPALKELYFTKNCCFQYNVFTSSTVNSVRITARTFMHQASLRSFLKVFGAKLLFWKECPRLLEHLSDPSRIAMTGVIILTLAIVKMNTVMVVI